MRIVALLPAATEIVAAVAPEMLVGVSHECDHPAWATRLPRVTRTSVDVGASSKDIDAQVRRLTSDGKPVIWVDAPALEALRPDLVITQGLCEVCAVSDGEVFRIADHLSTRPTVLSLAGKTLEGIYEDVRQVGKLVGRQDEAEEVVAGMKYKLRHQPSAIGHQQGGRPSVVVVEWIDPLFLAGHWVPELVEAAGGIDVGAKPGDHSHPRPWSDLLELKPDIIIVALCGFSIERAKVEWETQLPQEAKRVLNQLEVEDGSGTARLARPVRPVRPVRLLFIDGNTYTSRPGPRVVEGLHSGWDGGTISTPLSRAPNRVY